MGAEVTPTVMQQVVVHMAFRRRRRGDSVLGVEAEGPAATALLVARTLASHAACRLGQLLNLGQAVAAVALAAVLSTSYAPALGRAVVNAVGVADAAQVGTNLAVNNTLLSVPEAASILEVRNVFAAWRSGSLGSSRALASRRGAIANHGRSLPHSDCVPNSLPSATRTLTGWPRSLGNGCG